MRLNPEHDDCQGRYPVTDAPPISMLAISVCIAFMTLVVLVESGLLKSIGVA